MRFPIHGGVWFGGGRPTYCVTYFAKCIIRIGQKLPLGIFPVRNENEYSVFYPTEPGIYKAYLWKDQIEDTEIVGCEIEVIEGYGWPILTPPTKTPPRPVNRKKRIIVYALVYPLTLKVFYVGYTGDPEQRLIDHLTETSNPLKLERIQQLRAQGHYPLLMFLEEVDYAVAQEQEDWWKAFYWSRGHDLTNYCSKKLKKMIARFIYKLL